MQILIRLTKVEAEMLKELTRKDKRYKSGIEKKIAADIAIHYRELSG